MHLTLEKPEATSVIDASEGECASARAIRILLREHRALGTVLAALQRIAEDVVDRNAAADFALFASMLHYIHIFPERLHHPKESHHLFQVLRLRHPAATPLIDRLQDEHARMESMLLGLQCCFVAFQAQAPEAAHNFRDATAAYASFHFSHMSMEEQELLPLALIYLSEEDWAHIAQAFENNEDPAFGAVAQHHFERMRRQIEARSPSKVRKLLRQYGEE